MPDLPIALKILQEACHGFGYGFAILDTYSQHLVEVSKGAVSFVTGAGSVSVYPLNLNTAAQIAKDKAHTYTLLKNKGFRIPQGDYFFLHPEYRELRGAGKEIEDAFLFATRIGYPVFVKPNKSSCGQLAEMIRNPEELQIHLSKISEKHSVALIQEVVRQNEYRIFVLDGEIEYGYRKSPPSVVGNGRTSVSDLIDRHNERFDLSEQRKITLDSPFLLAEMERHGLATASILPDGFELRIAAKANLDAGGTICGYREEFSEACRSWCRQITRTMNLRVCGIDLFTTDDTLQDPQNFTLIEVNRNPFLKGIYLAGYPEKALAVWEKILEKYFSEHSTQ